MEQSITTNVTTKNGGIELPKWGTLASDAPGSGLIPGYGLSGSGVAPGELDDSGLGIDIGEGDTTTIPAALTETVSTGSDGPINQLITSFTGSQSPLSDNLVTSIIMQGLMAANQLRREELAAAGTVTALRLSDLSDDGTAETAVWNTIRDNVQCNVTVNINCRYGELDCRIPDTPKCYCQPGYFGDLCQDTCPGGIDNPCNDHGTCDMDTGNCTCNDHWDGDECDQCETGYVGTDCSVMQATVPASASASVAQIRDGGMIVTTDMVSIDVTVSGTYEMFSAIDENIHVFVRLETCSNGIEQCITGMLFQRDDNNMFVDLTTIGEERLAVMTDPQYQHNVYTTVAFEEYNLNITRTFNGFMVESTVSNSSFVTIVSAVDGDVTATFALDANEETGGILGSCDTLASIRVSQCADTNPCDGSDASNDPCALDVNRTNVNTFIESRNNSEMATEVARYQANAAQVNHDVLVEHENIVTESSGDNHVAVRLDDGGITTGLMPNALPEEFTLQLLVQPLATGGAILAHGTSASAVQGDSYQQTQTSGGNVYFTGNEPSLLVFEHGDNDHIIVHYDGSSTDTGIELPTNQYSEVDISYSFDTNELEVYVTPSDGNGAGDTTMSRIQLDDNAFQPVNAELTVGQVTPGVSSTIGPLNADIDEIRLLSRSTVPDQSTNDVFTEASSEYTPDLAMLFTTDDAENPLTDSITGLELTPVSGNQPSLVESSAPLSRDPGLFTLPPPRLFTVAEAFAGHYTVNENVNDATLTEAEIEANELRQLAEETCNSSIRAPHLVQSCSEIPEQTTDRFIDECIEAVIRAEDTNAVIGTLNSYVQFCQIVFNVPNISPGDECSSSINSIYAVGGENCNVTCHFGTVVNGTCECDGTHYGDACNIECAATSRGICNGFSTCSQDGECTCPSVTTGNQFNLAEFISVARGGTPTTNAPPSNSSSLDGCETCNDGWVGIDCSVAVLQVNNTGFNGTVRDTRVCLLLNKAVTLFDGLVMDVTSLGVFSIFKAEPTASDLETVEIQGLYEPCLGDHDCRKLTVVAVKYGTLVMNVYIDDTGNAAVTVENNGVAVDIAYPYNLEQPVEDLLIQLDWDDAYTVYITTNFTIDIRIAVFADELSLVITVPMDYEGVISEMCGDNDGDALDDTNFGRPLINGSYEVVSQTVLEEELLTSEYLAAAFRDVYSVALDDVFLITDDTYALEATAAGHMAAISGDAIECDSINIGPLTEFTLTGYFRTSGDGSSVRLATLETDAGSVYIKYESGTVNVYGQSGASLTSPNTALSMANDEWTYIGMSWRSVDGRLSIMRGLAVEQAYGFATGASIQVTGLDIGNGGNVAFNVDYVRMFNFMYSAGEFFLSDSHSYDDAMVSSGVRASNRMTQGLLLVATFDNFNAGNTEIALFDEDGTQTNSDCSGSESMFVSSSIPVDEEFDTLYVPPANYSAEIISECVEIFNENLTALCVGQMGSAVDELMLDKCLNEEITPQEFRDLYTVACVNIVPGVDECEFNGTMDLCENNESELQHQGGTENAAPSSLPIIAAIIAAAALIATILIIVFIRRRLKKKKEEEEKLRLQEEEEALAKSEDDIEAAANTSAPLTTAMAAPLPMPKPKQPMAVHRYPEEQQRKKDQEKKQLEKMLEEFRKGQQDLDDDDDMSMFKNNKPTPSSSTDINLDVASIASPPPVPVGLSSPAPPPAADPEFAPTEAMLASNTMPSSGPKPKKEKLGRMTPAQVKESLGSGLGDISVSDVLKGKRHTDSSFNKPGAAISVRDFLKKKPSQPKMMDTSDVSAMPMADMNKPPTGRRPSASSASGGMAAGVMPSDNRPPSRPRSGSGSGFTPL